MDDNSSKSAADKKAARSSAIEEQILEAQKRKEERSFLEELAKRISIAREGKLHSDKKEFQQAIHCYRRFLNITAQSVHVTIDELSPKLMDEKTLSGECLLISSILFDMMKILDKIETPTAKEERTIYHKLFIRFTINQTFQNYAAENMRKFLVYRKTVKHKQEFWATYNAIRIKRFCVVASWAFASEAHPAVDRLRWFRDKKLAQSTLGQKFVLAYYEHGEFFLAGIQKVPFSRPITRWALAGLVKLIT
jgi:hypothetical protein